METETRRAAFAQAAAEQAARENSAAYLKNLVKRVDGALSTSPLRRQRGREVIVTFGPGPLGLGLCSTDKVGYAVKIADLPRGKHGQRGAAEQYNVKAAPEQRLRHAHAELQDRDRGRQPDGRAARRGV